MAGQKGAGRRFNWKLAIVLVLSAAVLFGMLWKLRQWRLVSTAKQSLEAGRKAYEAKDWKKAATEMGRYVAVHPEAIEELLMYADAQLHVQPQKENNVVQARQAYQQVLRYQPENPKASDRLSQLYIQMGISNDAVAILERRLQAADDADARQVYAVALAMSGRYAQAAQEFGRVIETAPDKISAYQRLAELAAARPEEIKMSALEILRKAVMRNPNSAAAHIALAGYLLRYGGTQDAREQAKGELDTARRLGAGDPSTRVSLAARLIEMGDYAAAREELKTAGRDDPKLLALWLTWAVLERANGTPEEAGAVAKEALAQLGPEGYVFMPSAVELFVRAKDSAQARKTLEAIREADGRHPDLAYLEGLIAQGEGKAREAIRIWQAGTGQEKGSPRMRLALADAYQKVNDIPAAVRELRSLASQFPNAAMVRLALAKALGYTNAWREAASHAAAALELEPANIEAKAVELSARAHVAAMDSADEKAWRAIIGELRDLEARVPGGGMVEVLAADIAQLRGDSTASAKIAARLTANEATRMQGMQLEVEALWRGGKAAEAIALGREIVKQYPGATSPAAQLSDMLARTSDVAGGIAVVEEAIKAADAEGQKELKIVLARLYARAGETAKARAALEKTASEDPQDITSRILLINITDIKDKSAIQSLVDQIKKIEGEQGFRWKYQQARLWIFSDEWKSHQKEAVDLLGSNIKADPRDADSQLLLGIVQENSGRLSLAIEAYRRVYQQAPDSAQAVFYLVGALQKNNNLDEAGQILDEAAKRGIAEPRLAGLKLGQQLRQGQTGPAIQTVEELLQQQSNNLLLKIFLANLKMRQSDFAGAHAILDALDGEDANVTMAKVDLLMREGSKDEALALANKIVEKLDKAGAYLFRGKVLATMGRLDEAEADYQKVTKLEPDKPQGWVYLSDFLAARNKTADATKAIEKALDIDGKSPAIVARAARLFSVSSDAKVRQSADKLIADALAANPDDAELALFQAQRLISRGTTQALEQARKTLDDLARKRPELPAVWRTTAQAALLAGQVDSALEAISKGLASEPDDSQRRGLLMLKADAEKVKYPVLAAATLRGLWDRDHKDLGAGLALASAYVDSGEARKALPIIEEMRQSAQGKDALMLDLAAADALIAAGETEQAIDRARKAAASAPEDARAMVATVRLLAKADKVDEALTVVRDWQQAHQQDKAAVLMAGEALLMAGALPARPDTASEQKALRAQDAAIRVLNSAVAAYPDEYAFRLALAQALQTRGGTGDKGKTYSAEAEQLYREVLTKSPNNAVTLNNLAWLLAEDKERLKEAAEMAERGKEKFPEFAELIDTLGVIYQKMGKLGDAEKELREAVRLSRVNSRALTSAKFHLATILAAAGKKDEAMKLANEALGAPVAARLSPQDTAQAEELLSQLTSGAAGGPKQ